MARLGRWTLAAISAALLLLGLAQPAFAANGNAHFIKNATSFSGSGPNLTVTFKETGLSSGASEHVVSSASAATTYECVNGGGKNPSASNKRTFQTKVSQDGTFTADQNGNIVGSETLTPPTAADLGFTCPNGQTVTFVSVTYSNVAVNDTTSGASISLPGSYTYINPDAP